MTEDEMVGWHHRLNGHEFEQIQGDSVEKAMAKNVQSTAQLHLSHMLVK